MAERVCSRCGRHATSDWEIRTVGMVTRDIGVCTVCAPSDLSERATILAAVRRAEYEPLRRALTEDERGWLAEAFGAELGMADDPWLARHPTLVLPLLDADPLVRRAYPLEGLRLLRPAYTVTGEEVAMAAVMAGSAEAEAGAEVEEPERVLPEIRVEREWHGIHVVALEEERDTGGRAMHAETERLYDLLGDETHGRGEFWWARTGPTGGWQVAFTPYSQLDLLDTTLTSDAELAELAAHERALLEQPPQEIAPPGEPPWTYAPGDREFLAALQAERARRTRTGFVVAEERLPWTAEELADLELATETLFNDEASAEESEAADAAWERLRRSRRDRRVRRKRQGEASG